MRAAIDAIAWASYRREPLELWFAGYLVTAAHLDLVVAFTGYPAITFTTWARLL